MYGLPDSEKFDGIPSAVTDGTSEGPPTGTVENFASESRNYQMQNVMGGGGIMEEKLNERRKMIKDLTGEDFPTQYVYPEVADGLDGKQVTPSPDAMRRYGVSSMNAKTGYVNQGAAEQLALAISQEKRVEELRQKYPSIPSYRSLSDEAIQMLNDSREEQASISRRGHGFGPAVGGFAGNVAGSLQDPFTQLTLPFGGFGKTVAARVGSEALVQAGLQLFNQYAYIKPMKESFAQPFSNQEAVMGAVYAGVGGGLFRGTVEALPPAISALKAAPQIIPAKARAVTDRLAALAEKDTRLGRLAKSLTSAGTEDEAQQVLRTANPRDISDLINHADENPTSTPRMAMAAGEPEILAANAQPHGMDWNEHITRADTVAAAMETQTPLPAYEPTPGNIIGSDLPALSVRDLNVNADTFQYKTGGDSAGVTERLKGISQWSPEAAGNISVWENAEGKLYVADGHQRVGLAKRIMANNPDQEIKIPAYIYREADGYTSMDARAMAAFKNIGQGSGSALDAARVFQANPEKAAMVQRILSPNSELVKQGRALMNLPDEGLAMVDQGIIPENYAAIVGRETADHAEQMAILKVLQKADPDNIFQAEQIVRQALAEDIDKNTISDLFGERIEAAPLYADKAKVLDQSLKQIRKERSALNSLIKNDDIVTAYGNALNIDATKAGLDGASVLQYIVQKQAFTKGLISDLLSQAAREVQNGTRHATAARHFVESLRKQINDSGAASLLRDDGGSAAAVKQAYSEIAKRDSQDLFAQAVENAPKSVEPETINRKYDELVGKPPEREQAAAPKSAPKKAGPVFEPRLEHGYGEGGFVIQAKAKAGDHPLDALGEIGVKPSGKEGIYDVVSISVKPDAQKQGIGRALVEQAYEALPPGAKLQASFTTKNGEAFFEKLGADKKGNLPGKEKFVTAAAKAEAELKTANDALALAKDEEQLPLGELQLHQDGTVSQKLITMAEVKRDIADDDNLLSAMQECLL